MNPNDLHFMLDLETMATTRDAAIVAIGATRFNPVKREILDEFYINVTLKSNAALGRKIDPDTIEWWLKQSKEAQEALFVEPREDLILAMIQFCKWVTDNGDNQIEVRKYGKLWSNGPTFDEVIIRDAFEKNRSTYYPFPFSFRGSRCVRTTIEIAKALGLKKPKREGTHHNALDDARYQTEGVMRLFAELGTA